MDLPETLWWTLNRIDAIDRQPGTGGSMIVESKHLEILEEIDLIHVKAGRSGKWSIDILPEGRDAIARYRARQAQECARQFQRLKSSKS